MLDNYELTQIKGGSDKLIIGIIVVAVIFIIGVLDGYSRPLSCNP